MKVERKELIVIGAGPAGLSAAIEAARYGVHVTVFDENDRPGGQLFKQIHKFFGSKEHKAKRRGCAFRDRDRSLQREGSSRADRRRGPSFQGRRDPRRDRRGGEYGQFPGLDAAGRDRCGRCPDDDEPSSHQARQPDPDARNRQCRTRGFLPASSGRL